MRIKALMVKALMACCLLMSVVVVRIEAGPRQSSPAAGTEARRRVPATGYITGVVKGSNGPEAGVWVIAETADVGNKFRKIVVTDDQGRYLIPELPTAKYMVWVRGYGLVDSEPVQASPGQTVALTAVPAASARAAAEYYPPDSWYSLLQIPSKSEFPLTISGNDARVPGPNPPHATDKTFKSQAEWASTVRSCAESGCHQMGSKVTREVPASIGTFNSSKEAWERLLDLGQVNDEHFDMMGALRNDRGLAMFSNWTDRIAAGEVPPQPPGRKVWNATWC